MTKKQVEKSKKNTFDIFNPEISQVVAGTEGKIILIHSDERKLGKTLVGTQLPKPYYLRLEQGLNGISGVPYAPLNSWADFKKVNRKLTNPKTLKQAKELYQTIIFDTTDVAIKWCEFYVCSTQGVVRLNDGNGGYGLWKEYENEWFKEINRLTNAGYCVYFISHSQPVKKIDPETGEEYEQLVPKGDKRTIDLICDMADFIGYIKSNGINEKGEEVLSSAYFVETPEFLAGSRFVHMPNKLEVFSAENLQNAIKEAVEKEKANGGTVTTFEAQKVYEEKTSYTYEEILDEIKCYVMPLWGHHATEVSEIIEENLGEGLKISDATKKQLPQLEMVLFDLEELAESLDIEPADLEEVKAQEQESKEE